MQISACVIVKDEADNIARCIESYSRYVDEVIVVDTGSRDETVSIAIKAGAKVLHFQWENDFAKARNFAIEYAIGDWILFLDADEFFVKGTAANLTTVLQKADSNKTIDAIFVHMVHIDPRRGVTIGSDPVARIFRNDKRLRYVGNIHEMLMNKGDQVQAVVADKDTLLLHHTGYTLESEKRKAQRNLALLQELEEAGKANHLTYMYLSDCYKSLRQYDKVIHYADLFLQSKVEVFGFNCRPYVNKINAMFNMRDRYTLNQVYDLISEALMNFSDFPDFHRALAYYYYCSKQYSAALQQFFKTIEYNERYQGLEGNSLLGNLDDVFFSIALLSSMKNNEVFALEYYVKALQYNRFSEPSFRSLILLIGNQGSEDLILVLNSIYDKDAEQDVEFLVLQLARLKAKTALLYYQNIWKKQFGHEDITQLIVLLTQGQYHNAFRHFLEGFSESKDQQWELFAVVSALLSNNNSLLEEMHGLAQPTYMNIINSRLSPDYIVVPFTLDDINPYLHVLEEIILLGDFEEIERIIALSDEFVVDISNQIVALLTQYRRYHSALRYYAYKEANLSDYHYIYSIGYCYYKVGQYPEALNMFEQAIRLGYQANDIYELISWITKTSERPEHH